MYILFKKIIITKAITSDFSYNSLKQKELMFISSSKLRGFHSLSNNKIYKIFHNSIFHFGWIIGMFMLKADSWYCL